MYYTDPTEGALVSKAVEPPANSGEGIAVYSNGGDTQSADEYAAEHIMPAVQNALTKILDAMPETDHATEFVRHLREGGERQRDFIYSRIEPKTIQAMVSLETFSASISELYRSQMAVCRAHLNSHPPQDHPTRKNSDESSGSPTDSTAPVDAIPADDGYFNKVPIMVQLLPRGKVPEKDLAAAGNTESRQTSGTSSRVLSPLDGEGLSPSVAADAAGALTLDDEEKERAVLTKSGKTVKYQLPSSLARAASLSTSLMPSAGVAGQLLQGFNYGVPIPTADSPKTPNRFGLGGLALSIQSQSNNNNLTPTAIKGSGVVSPSHASAGLFDMEKSASLYPLPSSCIQTGTMPLFGLHCPNKADLEATFLHLRHAKGVTKNISLIFLLQNETVFIDKVPYAGNKWRSLCHAYGVNIPFRPLEEAIQSAILDERLSEGRRVAHHDCDTLDDVLESLELKANVTSTRMERIFCPDLSEHPHPLLQFSLVELLNEIVVSRVLPHAPDSAIVVADFAPSRLGLGLVQSCLATAMHCYADRFVPHKVLRRKKSNGDQMLEGDSEDDADADEEKGLSSGEGQRLEEGGQALPTDRRLQMSLSALAKGQHGENENLAQPIRTTTFQRINRRHEAMLERRAARDEHRRQAIARYRRELLDPENSTPDRIAKIHEKIATMQKIMLTKASRRQTRDEEYERFRQKGYSTAAVVIQASLRASLVRRSRLAQAAVSMSKIFGVPLSSVGANKESGGASTSKEISTELKRMYDALALSKMSGPSSLTSTVKSSEVPTLSSSGGAQPSTAGAIDSPSKLNEGKGALFGHMRLVVSELIAAYSSSALAWDPPFSPLVRTRPVDEWGWALKRIRRECDDDVDSEDEALFHSRRECVSRAAEREGRVTYDSRFARSGALAFVNICEKKPRRVDPYRETLRLMRLSGCDVVDHLVNVAESFAGCNGMQKRAYRLLVCVTHLVMNMSYCALRAHGDASVMNTCNSRPQVSLSDWLRTHHGALLEKLAAGHLAALCMSPHTKKGVAPHISSAGPPQITVTGSDWTVVSAKALPEG